MKILIVNGLEWGQEYNPFKSTIDFSDDVGQWFARALGGERSQYEIWRVQQEETPPSSTYDAIVIGGSLSSVFDPDPWIRRLEESLKHWIDVETPILGVCFGHQLIAQTLGGRVERNPNGWEIGRVSIQKTPEGRTDRLLSYLPDSFFAMQAHQDAVVELPPDAVSLAYSDLSECQAFRMGDRIRAIQFHPEFDPDYMRFLFAPRVSALQELGHDCSSIMNGLSPTTECKQVFTNFINHFIDSVE